MLCYSASLRNKKEYKDLYLPGRKPIFIEVPEMHFFIVNGQGEPGGAQYQAARQALYALSFTIKMSKMGGKQPEGYFEYVVPPLEGLLSFPNGTFDLNCLNCPRKEWLWTSMIRRPEFVTEEVFRWAVAECRSKKPGVDVSGARFETLREGLCVQIMHVGPYSEEPASLEKMHAFMHENGCSLLNDETHRHHELYFSDPRRTASERLKTVLRLPVTK